MCVCVCACVCVYVCVRARSCVRSFCFGLFFTELVRMFCVLFLFSMCVCLRLIPAVWFCEGLFALAAARAVPGLVRFAFFIRKKKPGRSLPNLRAIQIGIAVFIRHTHAHTHRATAMGRRKTRTTRASGP